MPGTDVTPQELRETDIREAWRGYHRDDVDELLERAAATIEHLATERDRLQAQPRPAAPAAAAPAAAAPAAAPARPVVPERRITSADTDVLTRTLQLAQKAADEAIAEAERKARELVTESEAKAQALVSDAEANARRIAESERRRLEDEIRRLSSARDALVADVDALERFESDYRDRMKGAIQHALTTIESIAVSRAERPDVHEIELPAPVITPDAPTTAVESVPLSDRGDESEASAQHPNEDWSNVGVGAWDDTGETETAPPAPSSGWDRPRISGDEDSPYDSGLRREPVLADPSALDDDAFFASLREELRDEAPLGPEVHDREFDDRDFDDRDFDDQDEHRRLFRRRR